MVEANQLPDATPVVSMAVLESSTGVTQMPKMPGYKNRVMATKAVAIKTVAMAMVGGHKKAHYWFYTMDTHE